MDKDSIQRILVAVYLILSVPGAASLLDMMTCPAGPNVTCCVCVSNPGCSWYSPPDGTASYCATSPYLQTSGGEVPAWARQPGSGNVSPAISDMLTVMRNEDFSLGSRPRQIKPQRVAVDVAVGIRHEFVFHVSARSSRIRLQVRGPQAVSDGGVEFSLHKAERDSCAGGLREIIRRRGNRRGRAGGRSVQHRTAAAHRAGPVNTRRTKRQTTSSTQVYPRRRTYSCRGGGPGLVHHLHLAVDVKRCLPQPVQLRVLFRESGRRSVLKVNVNSMCECPACSAGPGSNNLTALNAAPGPGVVNSTTSGSGTERHATTECNGPEAEVQCGASTLSGVASPWANLCQRRGVNEPCMPPSVASNGSGISHLRACSGRGSCLCGECVCSARHEVFPGARYTGVNCECDPYSCPLYNNAMCGGPARGRCQCGQCVCFPGFTGPACQGYQGIETCVSPDAVGEMDVCSGRGECVDGYCQCPWPFTGQYCQCDSEACPRHNGELCGGGTRGSCECGQCVCRSAYAGEACGVEAGLATNREESWGSGPPASCLDPSENVDTEAGDGMTWGMVCSGRGICVQGACRCEPPFSGPLCQYCPNCN